MPDANNSILDFPVSRTMSQYISVHCKLPSLRHSVIAVQNIIRYSYNSSLSSIYYSQIQIISVVFKRNEISCYRDYSSLNDCIKINKVLWKIEKFRFVGPLDIFKCYYIYSIKTELQKSCMHLQNI